MNNCNHFVLARSGRAAKKTLWQKFLSTTVTKKSKQVNISASNKSYKEHIYSERKGDCWNFDFAPQALSLAMNVKSTVTFYKETHESTKIWAKLL